MPRQPLFMQHKVVWWQNTQKKQFLLVENTCFFHAFQLPGSTLSAVLTIPPAKLFPLVQQCPQVSLQLEMGPVQPERSSAVKCPWQRNSLPGLTRKKTKAKEMSQNKRIYIPFPLHLLFFFFNIKVFLFFTY